MTESVQDVGYFGLTRMRFSPFLRVVQRGSFATLALRGVATSRLQLGVSEVILDKPVPERYLKFTN